MQPDLSKEHQSIAATTYFGGRVEACIVGEPIPCTYIDAVSMYPAIFTLLDLWFDQVIPARLVSEELDTDALQTLLDELHEDPRRLLDRTLWPRLAFFALVDPNGAQLPTRPTIPSPYVSKSARIAHDSARILDEQMASQEPYWRALDECGGKIIPDMVVDAKRKRCSGRASLPTCRATSWQRILDAQRPAAPTAISIASRRSSARVRRCESHDQRCIGFLYLARTPVDSCRAKARRGRSSRG